MGGTSCQLLSLAVACFFLSGCASFKSFLDGMADAVMNEGNPIANARSVYVTDRPWLSTRVRIAIERGDVVDGMTREDVHASIGQPADVKTFHDGHNVIAVERFRRRPYLPPSIDVISMNGKVVETRGKIKD